MKKYINSVGIIIFKNTTKINLSTFINCCHNRLKFISKKYISYIYKIYITTLNKNKLLTQSLHLLLIPKPLIQYVFELHWKALKI